MIAFAIRVLTYTFLILFPSGVLARIKFSTNVFVTPQDLVVLVIFILIIADKIVNKKYNFGLFFRLQALFVGVGILSLVFNAFIFKDIHLLPSILYPIRYISYLGLFLISPYLIKSKYIKPLVYGSGVTFVFFSFIQYFFYNSLKPLSYLGWDEHLYRVFSTFLDPNYSAVFLVFFSFLILPTLYKNNLKNSYLHLIVYFYTFLAVILTYSRTGVVALVSAVFTISLLINKIKLFFIGVLILVFCMVLFSDVKVEGLNPFRIVSSGERIHSVKNAFKIAGTNPIIGIGLNAYRDAQIRNGIRDITGASISNADAGTDNSFLFVLATTGIVGLFFFVWSYVELLRQILKDRTAVNIVLFSAVIGLIVGSMFLNVLFYTPILGFVLLVVAVRKNIA